MLPIDNSDARGRMSRNEMELRMTLRCAVVLVGLLLTATSPLRAQDYRYSTSSVRLRAEASVDSRVVMTLPRGVRVEVRACAVEWCWVEYGNRTGYIAERFLTKQGPQIAAEWPRTYMSASGKSVAAPLYSSKGVPARATARCRDGTYSFSQSKSGTCSNHGGVAQWL